MSDRPQPVDPDLLVAHTASVRALARRLVRDPGHADDLVQDTLTAAVERPPHTGTPLRPWLLSVARRLAARLYRGESRRARREAASACSGTALDAAAVVVRAESHRLLVDLVLELDEPYRTTLLLRYFDGLEPVEIARRQGLPAATVRTRVRRGLDQIRTRLDGRHDGDRRAWVALLLPLIEGPEAPPVTSTAAPGGPGLAAAASAAEGVLVMGIKAKLVGVAVVLAAAVWGGLELGDGGDGRGRTPDGSGDRAEDTAAVEPVRLQREPAAAAGDAPAAAATASEPTVLLRGRVLGPDGDPYQGASVRALAAQPPRSFAANLAASLAAQRDRGELGSPVESGVDGRFAISLPPGARLRLVAEAPGLRARQAASIVATTGASEVTLQLLPAGVLGIEVVDAGGAPIPAADIELLEPDLGAAAGPVSLGFARSDERGRASFQIPAQGEVALRVEHARFATEVVSYARSPDAIRRVVLRRGVRFHGRVLMAADRTPVAGASMVVTAGNHGAGRLLACTTTTDADGAFALDHVRPDIPCRVLIDAGSRGRAQSMQLLVDPAESFEVLLGGTRTIEGRVVVAGEADELRPAPGARLHFWEQGQMEWPLEVVAGPDGRFVLGGVGPAGGTLVLDLRDPSYLPQPPEYSRVPPTQDTARDLELRVALRGAIVGRVVDAARGAPIVGASIEVHRTGTAHSDALTDGGTTDAQGRFRVEGLGRPEETVVVVAKSPHGGVGWSEPQRMQPSADTDVGDVLLPVDRGLRGRVVDAAGAPVAGANVTVVLERRTAPRGLVAAAVDGAAPPVVTGADGSFVVNGLGALPYHVEVRKRGLRPTGTAAWDAQPDPADVGDIVLEAGFRLNGRVVDEEGRPVTDAVVRAYSRSSAAQVAIQVDADGRFGIDDLAAVPHSVYVQVPGVSMIGPREVDVPGELEVVVPSGAGPTIRGRVLGPGDVPVAGAQVVASATEAQEDGDPVWRVGITDPTGRFTLHSVPPGSYRLSTRAPGLQFPPLEDVQAGTRGAVLRGTRGSFLAGRVLDPQGRGVPGAAVHVNARRMSGAATRGQGGFTTAGPNGSFRVEGLRGEGFDVWVSGGDHVPVSVSDVQADSADVVLRFVRRGLSVSGTLLSPSGGPAASCMVSARAADGRYLRQNTVSGSNGRFVLRGLEDGQYTLLCSSLDQSYVGQVENVEAGTLDLRIELDWKRD